MSNLVAKIKINQTKNTYTRENSFICINGQPFFNPNHTANVLKKDYGIDFYPTVKCGNIRYYFDPQTETLLEEIHLTTSDKNFRPAMDNSKITPVKLDKLKSIEKEIGVEITSLKKENNLVIKTINDKSAQQSLQNSNHSAAIINDVYDYTQGHYQQTSNVICSTIHSHKQLKDFIKGIYTVKQYNAQNPKIIIPGNDKFAFTKDEFENGLQCK